MVTISAAVPRPAVRQRAAGLGDSGLTLRLTPLTTGRDNQSVQGHYRKLLPRRVATLSGSSAKARRPPKAVGLGVSARWLDCGLSGARADAFEFQDSGGKPASRDAGQ